MIGKRPTLKCVCMRGIKSSMCMYKFENEVTSLPLLWRCHLRHVTPLDQSDRS